MTDITPQTPTATPTPLSLNELVLLAAHLRFIYTGMGHAKMAVHSHMPLADVTITPASGVERSKIGDVDVWDSVTINGYSCGNRCGGARAYTRLVAGDAKWWSAT